MKSEISIEEIFHILIKWMPLIVLCAIVGGVLSGVYSWRYLDNVYQTSSIVMVSNSKDSSDVTEQMTSSEYNFNVQLVNSYSALCRTNRVLDQVIDTLDLPMTANQLSSLISVASVNDTEIIYISVRSGDPLLAQNICNTMTEVFQKEVINIMKMDNVQIIDNAPLMLAPISPNRERNVLIGVMLGIVLGAALGFALELLDNTVKTDEQIQELLGVPVLGTVPNMKGITKKEVCIR